MLPGELIVTTCLLYTIWAQERLPRDALLPDSGANLYWKMEGPKHKLKFFCVIE